MASQPSPRLRPLELESSVSIKIIRSQSANRNTPTSGGLIVDDSLGLRFFLEPTDTLHRRYEVLRAFFVERRPLNEIAQRSGYSYNTVRDLIRNFRAPCRDGQVPPFLPHPPWADRHASTRPLSSARTPRRWPTDANWTSPPDDASGAESPESSCSCPYWHAWASTRASTKPAIPALRWCRPPALC